MGDKKLKKELPSLYDYFYYDFWILNLLCKFKDIKDFFSEHGENIKDNYWGYLYLTEISIINIVGHMESFIGDDNLNSLIEWGNISLENETLMQKIKNTPEIDYILHLLEIRKQFSTLRFRECYDEKSITKQMNDLLDLLKKINDYFVSRYNISKLQVEEVEEKRVILNWILNNYNYIEVKPSKEDYNNLISLWPGRLFFSLMPKNMIKSYNLQNPKIKAREKNYLKGYTLALYYLYYNLLPQINKFEKNLLYVTNWRELHQRSAKIFKNIVRGHDIYIRLFNIKLEKNEKIFRKKKIKSYKELMLVLKGRKVRVIKDRFSGDDPNSEALFMYIFWGAINMYRYSFRNKPEIIEFKQAYENEDWVEYSYAIYIPVSEAFGDSSHWLIFKRLCVESGYEPIDSFKEMINSYIKLYKDKKMLSFHKYEIEGDLLEKYMERNDYSYVTKKRKDEELKGCKGLLGEFLAGFYLVKKEDIKNIIRLDFHRDVKNTDIDAVVETKDRIIIMQVKSSFYFEKNECEDIIKYFNKVISSINVKNKKIERILFVLTNNLRGFVSSYECNYEEVSEDYIVADCNERDMKKECKDLLRTHNIKILLLSNLLKILDKESSYGDLLRKLDIIYSMHKEFCI